MKKYLSGLLVLALFLNSFSVFAMKKREEDVEYSEVLDSVTGMDMTVDDVSMLDYEGLYNDLKYLVPDHLIVWKILPFLDTESLENVSKTNKFFRRRVGEFLNPIDLQSLQNGVFGELFGFFWKHEEVRELITKLESEIRKSKNLFLYKYNNELKIRDFTRRNVKHELFFMLRDCDPKVVKGP